MAKHRHQIFEMYDFRNEAIRALTPKSADHVTKAIAPASWSFKQLAAACSGGVTHVDFKSEQDFGEDTLSDLRTDFAQLADGLDRDSRVLLDFDGVKTFCAASVDELALFDRKLRNKGSRIVLCRLAPATRVGFFPVGQKNCAACKGDDFQWV